MHAAPCFPTGLALGARRWSRGPELARVAVRSQSRQLARAGPQSAARMRQYFLKPEYFVVLVNGMVLNKHSASFASATWREGILIQNQHPTG